MTKLNGHQVATWSGVSAFFATLLAVGVIDIFNPSDRARLLSSIVVGLITAGAVYAKTRLDDAKNASGQVGNIVVQESEGVKQYSLELSGHPDEIIEPQSEVTFKVVKREP